MATLAKAAVVRERTNDTNRRNAELMRRQPYKYDASAPLPEDIIPGSVGEAIYRHIPAKLAMVDPDFLSHADPSLDLNKPIQTREKFLTEDGVLEGRRELWSGKIVGPGPDDLVDGTLFIEPRFERYYINTGKYSRYLPPPYRYRVLDQTGGRRSRRNIRRRKTARKDRKRRSKRHHRRRA
jgi:hypothetical protein